jgi:integrase
MRLNGQPGSPEFLASIHAAERLIAGRLDGTFNGLARDYTASVEFEKLGHATQAEYRRMLTKAEREFGNMPIAALDDPRVRKDFMDWRAKVARTSGNREADNRLSIISSMLSWSVENGRLTANNLKGFKRLYHSNRSELIWLPDHIAKFMAVAPVELQRAMILGLHTGQRQSDILHLTWSAYDGTWIRLRQRKSRRDGVSGALIEIPCTVALRRMLDGMAREHALILTTKTGRPFKKRYFADLWDRATTTAGIENLHFHDLRGTAVTMLSEAGSTPQMIATITGHSLKTVTTILERYLARTRPLAEQAMFHFENSPRTKFANQMQTGATAPKGR